MVPVSRVPRVSSVRTVHKAGRTFAGATGGILSTVDAMEVIRLYMEYRQVAEVEETKRQEIRAKADQAIARILTDREVLLKAVEHTAKERKASLDAFFHTLDEAVKNRDDHQLDIALAGILGIIKTPFLMGLEEFRKSMETDNGTQLEL